MSQSNGYPKGAGCLIEIQGTDEDTQTHIQKILDLYNDLSQRADLTPSTCINHRFEKLVGLCTTIMSTAATRSVGCTFLNSNDQIT